VGSPVGAEVGVSGKPPVLFSEEQISARIGELGKEIAQSYVGEEICLIGLMKSCLVFMADIMRAIPGDMTCHFLRANSVTEGTGSLRTDIVYSTEIPYEGRQILLLDDVIDTGITLSFLLNHIQERKPRSLKVCTLIDKPSDRKIEVQPDWAAFTIKEPAPGFIVGYGLDFEERYRGLPYLGTIPRPERRPVEGRKITLSPEGS
jgi:hypoxanthine phosphoribosyltransferase